MNILVFTTVYPNSQQKNLGIFVHERMRRVANLCDLKVVAPIPCFPFAGFFKEKYRVRPPRVEIIDGVEIHHPRFFLVPGYLKFLDGFFLFLSAVFYVSRLKKQFPFDIIDGHFAYPDGFAAVLLGRFFHTPVTITLRGTINRMVHIASHRYLIGFALRNAAKIFSVSRYLIDLAGTRIQDIPENKITVIPNGVDPVTFKRLNKDECRKTLEILPDSRVLISAGGLVERKGHHRVLQILPMVKKQFPDILYIIAGSGGVEGDMTSALHDLVQKLDLADNVRFTGELPQASLNVYLSAADVFVLPTRFEGWPNVFFEAMACGLPVVSTLICGNKEIVQDGFNGFLVPFDDASALSIAVTDALEKQWDREKIMDFACSRPWEKVAAEVYDQLVQLHKKEGPSA